MGALKVLCFHVQILTFQRSTPTQHFRYQDYPHLFCGHQQSRSFQLEVRNCSCDSWVLVFSCMIKGIPSSGKVNS